MSLDEALEIVKDAGYVVLREKSYRQAQERQRRAEAYREMEQERRESSERWARDCLAEERRLRDRLTFVFGVACRYGATTEDLNPINGEASDTVKRAGLGALDDLDGPAAPKPAPRRGGAK